MNKETETIRKELNSFWNEQLDCNVVGNSCNIAYPLLLPNGWQLTFSLYKNPVNSFYTLSDNGKIFNFLQDYNVYNMKSVKKLIKHKCDFFGISEKEKQLVIEKTNCLPSATEIELFAEGLQAISYLIYRYDENVKQINVAVKNFEELLKRRQYSFNRNFMVKGKVIPEIKFDYSINVKRQTLCKITERSTDLHSYMEKWGFRFSQVKEMNNNVPIMMVYNPDHGNWDDLSLKIGKNICDLFIPYYETREIDDFVKAG